MRSKTERNDFKAIGLAIKEAREKRGWTREYLAEKVDLTPRYIMSIENNGQHPAFQVFYRLVTLLGVSVDQYIFPEKAPAESTRRRFLDELLEPLSDNDLIILEATAQGILRARTAGE